MKRLLTLSCFAFLFCCLIAAAPARAASTATAVVQEFYNTLQDTMKQGPTLGFEGRYKKLDPAVTKAFNLPFMAKYAVGPNWTKASKDEQASLVANFSAFSIATYASRFTKFDGEVFEILSEKPMSGKDTTLVETRLLPNGGDPVALNYVLRPDETGVLRIVDVYLDASISELATRRAEFGSVVKREGLVALISSLFEKTKKMGLAQAS